MVCGSRLLAVMMAFVCTPGFGTMCSICNDMSSKGRILACIHQCTHMAQEDSPQFRSLALDSDSNDVLLNALFATLASEGRSEEPDPKSRSEDRRSYSMEHFRWGKPTGRKRRPVKVFASSIDGGDSSEGRFLPQVRRQLSNMEDETAGALDLGSPQSQGLQGMRLSPKPDALLKQQERKDGTYRMSHFRWGSPPATKRYGSFMRPWEEKPQGRLLKLYRDAIVKDVP
ncbi:pro-opiomelanocortin B-like [Myripristis murdjan]|uniref:pro-opiomelanocortin B-like n=1 Tax=Myripristis murdjan TaxID=586833 RepID=UPI0011761467|nr:pro-opiomelanocortin B-like [Myripristis murdjan]